MSLKAADIDRIFSKLRMETRNSGDKLAWFVYNGHRLLHTKRSHGRGDIPGRIGDFIRQQLRINERQFGGLRDCSVDYDDYVEILRAKGIVPAVPDKK